MTETPDDGRTDPAAPDDSATPATPSGGLLAATGFGPALGGLLIAFLGSQGNVSGLLGYATGNGFYRFLVGLLPVLMGGAGIALGVWTLRREHDRLARAIAAAALVVGSVTVVTGAVGWWGQELTHDSMCGAASYEPFTDTSSGAIDPSNGAIDPSIDAYPSVQVTPDGC